MKYNVEQLIIDDAKVVRCRSCGQITVLRDSLREYNSGCNRCLPEPSSARAPYAIAWPARS